MKAKDLAALLLQNPDADVFIETYDDPDFNSAGYSTEEISGVVKTPSGIFIETASINYYPKSPSEKPKIGTISLMMTDGERFRLPPEYSDLSELKEFDEIGYISNYIGWHDGYWILAASDINDEYIIEKIEEPTNTRYIPSEVDYVEVLVGLDESTWTPVYQKFTLKEAIKYAKGEL